MSMSEQKTSDPTFLVVAMVFASRFHWDWSASTVVTSLGENVAQALFSRIGALHTSRIADENSSFGENLSVIIVSSRGHKDKTAKVDPLSSSPPII